MALARVACPSAWVGGGLRLRRRARVLGVLKEGFVGGEYLRLRIHREEPQLQIELDLPVRQLLGRREPAMAVPYYGVLYHGVLKVLTMGYSTMGYSRYYGIIKVLWDVWGTQGATEGTR
jgi:hypothetical protein